MPTDLRVADLRANRAIALPKKFLSSRPSCGDDADEGVRPVFKVLGFDTDLRPVDARARQAGARVERGIGGYCCVGVAGSPFNICGPTLPDTIQPLLRES